MELFFGQCDFPHLHQGSIWPNLHLNPVHLITIYIYWLAEDLLLYLTILKEGIKNTHKKKKGIGKHCFHLALMVQENFML